MKKLAKRTLRRFGYIAMKRESGIYLPEDDFWALLPVLCPNPKPLVVDGGAHKGDVVRSVRRVLPDARFICFEPDQLLFEELKAEFGGDVGVVLCADALGDCEGEMILNINASRATNSLLESSQRICGTLKALGETRRSVRVPVTTLDKTLARKGLGSPDIIKLDLQGYDYFALSGAVESLRSASVVIVEIWFDAVYRDAPLYLDICNFMAARHFRLYTISGLHYARDDRLLWADALFVPAEHPVLSGPVQI